MMQSGKGRILLRAVLPTLPRPLMVGAFSIPWHSDEQLFGGRTNLRTRSERLKGVIRRLDPDVDKQLVVHDEEVATRYRVCDCKHDGIRCG